jgi:hypothetical protein
MKQGAESSVKAATGIPDYLVEPKASLPCLQGVSVLSGIRPVHTVLSSLSKMQFNIMLHLHLSLPIGHFPRDFPTERYMASFFSHSCYVPCQSHSPLLDHSEIYCHVYHVCVVCVTNNSTRIRIGYRIYSL